jgi:ATP-binding cassette subfamily B protein
MAAAMSLDANVNPASRISGTAAAGGLPRREIRFNRVRFAYPGATRNVFDGLDLTIPAGRSTAIVGSNGAGKTTLIKLLGRLYDPSEGNITVDGLRLTSLSPAGWRARLAVVFQDFTAYEMSARDNIAFGASELAQQQSALVTAAQQAGALDLIEGLSAGWDTILSRAYTGGTDLSGGQWQRIALARALLAARRGGVLVLDEPTASLDVRAEAEIFDRFLDLTEGLTTILISHRFSSVRHASRIVVIEKGAVLQEGSHDDLIQAGGRYAEMFTLQATRFQ